MGDHMNHINHSPDNCERPSAPSATPSLPFVPFVDLPVLPSDHRLSETNPLFLAEPLPHPPAAPIPPSPKQKISKCATLLSHDQNCLAARLRRPHKERIEMTSTPCKSLKKDRTPCRGNGLEQLDGYCIAHTPAGKAWQWRSRGGKASSPPPAPTNAFPTACAAPSKNCPPASTRSSRACSNPPPRPQPPPQPVASCPPPPVCCHAPKTFSPNLS